MDGHRGTWGVLRLLQLQMVSEDIRRGQAQVTHCPLGDGTEFFQTGQAQDGRVGRGPHPGDLCSPLEGVGERGGAGGTGNTLRVEQTIAYSPWSSLAGEIGSWAVGQAWARIITITPHPTPPPSLAPRQASVQEAVFFLTLRWPRGLTGSGTELSGTPGTAPGSATDTPAPHPPPPPGLLAPGFLLSWLGW